MKPSSAIIRKNISEGRQHRRLIALALSALMLFSILLVAFHHHDDGQDHDDDCSVCAVAHHRTADITITLLDAAYLPFSFPACFATLVLAIAIIRFCHSPQNRAPPL
jgi:hypothetical protein